jgi:cytochrome c biogenesis protein CcmG, thiol:disulfide interchange protein DsbE
VSNPVDTVDSPAPTAQREHRPARRRLKPGQIITLAIVLALLAVTAFQMRLNGPLAAGRVGAGERAPDFTLQTFDGETVTLSDLRGQVVVVNFWASWCKPCEEEAADLENTWLAYRDQGVVLVGIAYVDTETAARRYIERFQVTYPNGLDLGTRISHRYRVRSVPETFVVDRDGQLVAVFIGPVKQADLQSRIEPLLAP